MNLRRIELFLSVVREGSINRAAQTHGITQAGMTKSIRALEDELGITLFRRSTRGVSLTQPGHTFLRYARVLSNQSASARKAVRAAVSGEDMEIRIGVAMSWALRLILPDILAELNADWRHPRINVVANRQSWQMIQSLRNGDLDLVLATPTEQDDLSGCDRMDLGNDRQRMVVRRGHALDRGGVIPLSELCHYDWIAGQPETYFRRLVEARFLTEGLAPPQPRITSDSNRLMLDLVSRTDLVGYSTWRLVSVAHRDRVVMLQTAAQADRCTTVLTRSGDVLPQTAQTFVAFLARALKPEPAGD